MLIASLLAAACKSGGGEPKASAAEPAAPKEDSEPGTESPTTDEKAPPQSTTVGEARDVKLTASDGVTVYGHFDPPSTDAKAPPVLLLFHQARSNRAEYTPTIQWLNGLGYATLSIDQRSGGTMWERDNQTVQAQGESTSFDAAYPDLVAALEWAKAQGHQKILAVGSSYTAALVFRLGSERADDLRGIAAFSPGEYLEDDNQVGAWAKTIEIPTFVTSSPAEYNDARALMKTVPAAQKLLHRATKGVHGASALRADKNPDGFEEYKTFFKEYLETVL